MFRVPIINHSKSKETIRIPFCSVNSIEFSNRLEAITCIPNYITFTGTD